MRSPNDATTSTAKVWTHMFSCHLFFLAPTKTGNRNWANGQTTPSGGWLYKAYTATAHNKLSSYKCSLQQKVPKDSSGRFRSRKQKSMCSDCYLAHLQLSNPSQLRLRIDTNPEFFWGNSRKTEPPWCLVSLQIIPSFPGVDHVELKTCAERLQWNYYINVI